MASTRVTRRELYEQVWTTPVHKLAATFGITGTALAKTCRRLRIPTPWRGYWAKLAAGEKVPWTRLPFVRDSETLTVTFDPNRKHVEPTPAVPIPVVEVRTTLVPRPKGDDHELAPRSVV